MTAIVLICEGLIVYVMQSKGVYLDHGAAAPRLVRELAAGRLIWTLRLLVGTHHCLHRLTHTHKDTHTHTDLSCCHALNGLRRISV